MAPMTRARSMGTGRFGLSGSDEPWSEAEEKWRELFNFEAPYLEEKLFAEGKFSDPEQYRLAFRELKRYFILLQTHGKHLGMTDCKVDEVWHQFILFTPQYHRFCQQFFGEYIHHVPNTSYTGGGEGGGYREFAVAYGEVFGDSKFLTVDDKPTGSPDGVELGADCRAGGCSGCGGGTGCSGCKSGSTVASAVYEDASCKSCNACGGCRGCKSA